jgi:hypothetical protein
MNCWIEQLKAAKHSLSMRRDAWNLSMRRARDEPVPDRLGGPAGDTRSW